VNQFAQGTIPISEIFDSKTIEGLVLKLSNVSCQHCKSVCDVTFKELSYAYGVFDGFDKRLYLGVQKPSEIIPALHLIEEYHSLGYRPKDVKWVKKLNRGSAVFSNPQNNNNIQYEKPETKTRTVIYKRERPPTIESLFNLYNELLWFKDKIEFPMDTYLNAANSENFAYFVSELESNGVEFKILNGKRVVAFFEKDLPEYLREFIYQEREENGIKKRNFNVPYKTKIWKSI